MIAKYFNPQNDLAFKKIFGQEKHKNIPIAFLNAVFNLKGENAIIDLEFVNTIQPPEIASRKESVVDVMVEDQAGSKYIIEMQVAKTEGFEKRAQFYAAKTYCSQFNKIIFLAITTYTLFKEKDEYKSDCKIFDENDLSGFSFTYVELPKFTKTLAELNTIEEKWYYFLKHAEDSNDIDAILASDPEIKDAYGILERTRWTDWQIMEYERVGMAVTDFNGAIAAARKEGFEQGLAEALEEIQKKKQQIAMAIRLLQKQHPIEEIAELTELSVEELMSLKDKSAEALALEP
jgi:predicted transposase/invertase (TIGR01784 family)